MYKNAFMYLVWYHKPISSKLEIFAISLVIRSTFSLLKITFCLLRSISKVL